MKVAKFGGTSLATPENVQRVFDIVRSDPDRRLIVVSAPGKRTDDDTKVTDLLIAAADARLAGNAGKRQRKAIVERFRELAETLGVDEGVIDEIDADLAERMAGDRSNRASFTDALKAAGEDNCARFIAAYFRAQGLEASYVDPGEAGLLLSDEPGNAQVLAESYESLSQLGKREGIMIFPGFFGYTRRGDLVTFPRGGSDITGAILAAAVQADVYENFTDVEGVRAVSPRVVPDAKLVPELTYRELRELAYTGFSVIQAESLMPCYKAGVPVNIRSTLNPASPGTLLVKERTDTARGVVGIAAAKGFATLFVSKYLMHRQVGFGRKLLQILEEEGVSYEHTPSGIDNISVIVRDRVLNPAVEARIMERIQVELEVDEAHLERGLALVMCVGEGMCRTVGIACRATGALSKAGINIEMINQGSSEVSLMFGIRETQCDTAVRALNDEFFTD